MRTKQNFQAYLSIESKIVSNMGHWTHFTNSWWAHNPNLVKLLFVFTWKIMVQSGQKFAHATTAELSWHVQISDLIGLLFLIRAKGRFPLGAHKCSVKWVQSLVTRGLIGWIKWDNWQSASPNKTSWILQLYFLDQRGPGVVPPCKINAGLLWWDWVVVEPRFGTNLVNVIYDLLEMICVRFCLVVFSP